MDKALTYCTLAVLLLLSVSCAKPSSGSIRRSRKTAATW